MDGERVLTYRKVGNGTQLLCRVHISSDGSALVEGDGDLEILYEEEAADDAIAYVEQLGYVRISDSHAANAHR